MNTWIFKGAIAALALTGLSACEDGQSPFSGLGMASSQALARVKMANGSVTLVPPQGFCIDKRSVKPHFALMARCDVLGAPDAVAAAPLGIITVSLLEARETDALPSPAQTASAASLTRVVDPVERDGTIVFRADGPAPIAGLGTQHWRGTAKVGGYFLGVAFYAPATGRALSTEGRAITRELIARTKAAS